jgi:hypothetical protein
MGLFPIAMNILQFWLIDSIVKATQQPAVALDSEEGHDSDVREPLFRASEDDDDDDDAGERPRDIESARPRPPSRTPSKTSGTGDEHKSTATITPGASTSSTPGTSSRAGASFAMHAYPPRDRSTPPTPDDEEEPSPTSARSNSSRRRSPPPPLLPRSPLQPAINSPSLMLSAKAETPGVPAREKRSRSLLSATQTQAQTRASTKTAKAAEKDGDDWDVSWGDDGDDWAERVGEEDWTGRRVDAARGFVGAAWDASRSPAQAPSPAPISVG